MLKPLIVYKKKLTKTNVVSLDSYVSNDCSEQGVIILRVHCIWKTCLFGMFRQTGMSSTGCLQLLQM